MNRLYLTALAGLSLTLAAGATAHAAVYSLNDATATVSTDQTTDTIDIGSNETYGAGVTVDNGGNPVTWTNTGDMHVGYNDGSSTPASVTYDYFQLNSGASLYNSGVAYLGWGANKRVGAQISDGAYWQNGGYLQVSDGGPTGLGDSLLVYGQLDTLAGGSIGIGAQSNGTATVQGPAAQWTNTTFPLEVGSVGGNGTLDVTETSTLSTPWLMVGTGTGYNSAVSSGQLTVQGDSYYAAFGQSTASTVTIGDYLSIGEYGGSGTVDVQDLGRVNINSRILLGLPDTSNPGAVGIGTLNVHAGGRVTVGSKVESWAGSTVDVSDGGHLLIGLGNVDTITDGTVQVGPGGTLAGTGAVIGNVVVNGGEVSPGHSPGLLTVTGDLTLDPSSTLTIQIGGTGAGQFDQLNASGALALAGTLNLEFIDGYTPPVGSPMSFDMFSAGNGITGGFQSVQVTGLGGGRVTLDPTALASGQLAFTAAVPEPASLGLLVVAAGALLRRRRA